VQGGRAIKQSGARGNALHVNAASPVHCGALHAARGSSFRRGEASFLLLARSPYNRPHMSDETANRKHIALYAGSFDPITHGHLDVLARARRMFDEVVLGIGHNPDKMAMFTADDREAMARMLVNELVAAHPQGAPVRVGTYGGLTVDYARSIGACALVRGVRNVTDLAAECQLAITNRQLAEIETVFIVTGEQYAFTSSSLIRQVAAQGGSLERLAHLVPPIVIERMRARISDPRDPLTHFARDGYVD